MFNTIDVDSLDVAHKHQDPEDPGQIAMLLLAT